MPVLFLFSYECACFAFLLGAYFASIIFGISILGLSALIMYALYQRYYNNYIFIWGGTLLGTAAVFSWTSSLDLWLGTNFIAIFLSIAMAIFTFLTNRMLFLNYNTKT